MYLVNLVEGTLDICTAAKPGFREGFEKGALFDRRVRICEELYSGRIDFSSLTNRVSKLDNIAGEVCHLVAYLASGLPTSHSLRYLPGLVQILL